MLLVGIGNPARGDDGLGPALVERLQTLNLPGLSLDSDYQLAPELAADLAGHERVIFADATLEPLQRPRLAVLEERTPASFTSHGMHPGEILYLARTLFDARPRAYTLAIPGQAFEMFDERLSAPAQQQLEQAVALVRAHLASGDWP